MKYVIHSEEDIKKVPKSADSVHIARPIKFSGLQKLLRKCKLKEIRLSKSCKERLGVRSRKLLREKRVSLRLSENRGRAIGIGMKKIMEIVDMHKDERSYREIEAETGIPKSTVHYLIKYANRAKVKDKGITVYLK